MAVYQPFSPMRAELAEDMHNNPSQFDVAFGMGWCDLRALLWVQGDRSSGDGVTYLEVRTAPSDIEAAINAEPFWQDQFTRASNDSVVTCTWTDEDIDRRTAVRRIAYGGQLRLFGDQFVSWDSRSTGHREKGQPRRLLERDHVQTVAEQLDGEGAVAIHLVSGEFGVPHPSTKQILDEFVPEALEPWDVLGLGATIEADGNNQLIAVLAHSTTADATVNAERLRENLENGRNAATGDPWSESIFLADVRVSSNLVVVTIVGVDDARPFEVGFDALRGQHGIWHHSGQ